MNATKFFDTILPTQGLRGIALAQPESRWRHSWYTSTADLMAAVARFDAAGETVYFTCSSFQPIARKRKTEGGGRTQANVLHVRSLFVDLDVRDPRDPKPAKRPEYATWQDAATAIINFAKALKLPKPWLVRSGVGIHAYWPMLADLDLATWKVLAEALKRALVEHKVLFDPSRTADAASVLRPPGSTHRKFDPKPVFLILEGAVTDHAILAQRLLPWMMAPSAAPANGGKLSAVNSALGGGMGYDPSSAHKIADRCGVIGFIRDEPNEIDQPTWYYGLGVLMHTDEAPDICHEWSKGHDEYSAAETDANLARLANHGATTCAKLAEYQPELCEACPYFGKITSPVQLGRAQYDKGPDPEPATASGGGRGAFGGGTTSVGPDAGGGGHGGEDDMPHGYRGVLGSKGHRVLEHWIKGDEKNPGKWDVFCDTYLRPLQRYEKEKVHFNEWLIEDRNGERTFELQGGVIGKGGRDVAGALGDTGVVVKPGKERVMDSYLKHWMDKLKEQPLTISRQSFGWTDDLGFVTGDVVIHADGTESPALLHNMAKTKQEAVRCMGDLAVWKDLVDRAYNQPGQEAFQFQLLCSFAAPLLKLTRQVQGVTVYAHSSGSGVGKTTVQRVALSVWGDWQQMMLANGKTTENAMWGLMGAYSTLPVVYDELTNAKQEDVSGLVFSVSQGRAKERMTQAATLRENNSNWTTILLASGNTRLSDKLAGHRANAEAEIARLFEFTQEETSTLTVVEAGQLFPQFDDNYGHAGLAYARFLVKHRGRIAKMLAKKLDEVNREFDILPVDRHWASLFACVLVARRLCEGLRLVCFEEQPLIDWMHDRLEENREQKSEAVTTEEDQLSAMINDLWPRVLITLGVGTRRNNGFADIQGRVPTDTLKGRKIIGQGTDPSSLWLARPAIMEWCRLKGANHYELHRKAVALGWASDRLSQRILAQGTDLSSGAPVWCWIMDPDKMPDVSPEPALTVIQGGKAGRGRP